MAGKTGKQRFAYDYPRPMATVGPLVLMLSDGQGRVLLIRVGHEPW